MYRVGKPEDFAAMVVLLLGSGADVNVRDGRGDTPLSCAYQTGNSKIVEMLEKAGAK
jgi:ankyrin repeat protein